MQGPGSLPAHLGAGMPSGCPKPPAEAGQLSHLSLPPAPPGGGMAQGQLCHLASPAPRPAVYAGTGPGSLPPASPGPPALPHGTACPSPISVALDSTAGTGTEPQGPSPGPSGGRRSRAAGLSFSRLLKRGCWTSPVFATLSPRCPAVPHGKVQPLGEGERRPRPDSKAVSSFFQIKADTPLESRTHPTDSEETEDNRRRARKDSAKEVICPWENPTEEGRVG
ncbi:regulator of G-protein signaling 9 [Nyctibius grandis]|uniref:regulator of G-protein signaling 9 n=1 Tax=Nyctibius grandis TaxID=48427 RepID=UPI0035BC11B9